MKSTFLKADPVMTPFHPVGDPEIYPVGEDTLLLLDAAQEEIRSADRVLEVGVGSGHIVKHFLGKATCVVATDINPHAVRRAKIEGIEVIRTDLVAGICGSFDLILFNPPYLPTRPEEKVDDWLEYALDGGVTGREVIARFAVQAGPVLAEWGRILLLISSLTGQRGVEEIFVRQGFSGEVMKRADIEGETLFVYRFRRAE
jgi:release factor glutamine methyltransferase